jgi:alpha-galactosidase
MKESILDQLGIRAEDLRMVKGGGYLLSGAAVSVGLPAAPRRYLYHGWQSWSLAAWVECARPVRPSRPYSLHPLQTDPAHALDAHPHGSWLGAVEMDGGQVVLLGALGLDSHVALRGTSLEGWYEAPAQADGEPRGWFLGAGEETEVLARYAELLGTRLDRPRRPPPRVWCSWYSLYTQISENALLKVLGDLGDPHSPQGLPFEVFQVDDGWQAGIGDWEPNGRFPSGMEGLAARIRETGRTAGLWLAPMLAAPTSAIFRNHRDWLLRDDRGRLVSAGFNWGQPLYTIDTTHPEALDWLASLMKRVRAWGYDYVKLDFLYAGALPGNRRQDMTREAAYRQGLQTIREALGEAFFLACGAPIMPSLGLCDALRIGPDVAGSWENRRDSLLLENHTTPGTRNAIRTSLHRLWLRPLVHTDPDVVYFRSRNIALTAEQKSLLQDLGALAGFKATSDVPAWLTQAERASMREYLEARPTIQALSRYRFQIGDRQVDFADAACLPPLPGRLDRVRGAALGRLADVPALMRAYERISRKALERALRKEAV